MLEVASQVLAGLVVARGGYVAGRGLYTSYIGSLLGKNTNLKKMGKWAVVTGSTDGLGKAYAVEMAKRNLNLVLISRSQDKLTNVASEIARKYNVETMTIQADFTRNDMYGRIGKELENLDIGVLVNNVGMTYDYPKPLTEVPEKQVHDLINCNIVSTTMMTKLVLEGMQKRNRGVIINMSTLMQEFPIPYLLLYSSLKHHLVLFSRGLAAENRGNNIVIQCVIPGIVTTKFSGVRKTNLLVTTPETYVAATLRSLGLETYTYGPLTYRLQATVRNFFNYYVHESLVDNFAYNFMSDYRRRAIKRNKKIAEAQKKSQTTKVEDIEKVTVGASTS